MDPQQAKQILEHFPTCTAFAFRKRDNNYSIVFRRRVEAFSLPRLIFNYVLPRDSFIQPAQENRPLPARIIRQLTEEKLTDEKISLLEHKNCAICRADYLSAENQLVLPCNHRFHSDCLFRWFEQHHNCPLCRKNIEQFYR